MLSRETLEAYRQMSPSERLALSLRAMRESLPYLLRGSPEVVARRFERIRMQNDLGNRRILERLAAAERSHGGT